MPPEQLVLRALGLGDPGHPYLMMVHGLRRDILRTDERIKHRYLETTPVPKLHIGSGGCCLAGWLNTDLDLIPGTMRMDATKRFPFRDGTFAYVYSEHMIEHVPYKAGLFMLRECHRVMRKGAAIRLVTPDIATIVDLYSPNILTAERQKYLSWFSETFVPSECPRNAVSAINAMFRLWGHQFIYDEATLCCLMRTAGFSSIKRRGLHESGEPELENLANHERYPPGLLDFESLTLEGRK